MECFKEETKCDYLLFLNNSENCSPHDLGKENSPFVSIIEYIEYNLIPKNSSSCEIFLGYCVSRIDERVDQAWFTFQSQKHGQVSILLHKFVYTRYNDDIKYYYNLSHLGRG